MSQATGPSYEIAGYEILAESCRAWGLTISIPSGDSHRFHCVGRRCHSASAVAISATRPAQSPA
jgi:hypothetical protein